MMRTLTAVEIRALAVNIMVDNLAIWSEQISDLNDAQLAEIAAACAKLGDAVLEIQARRRGLS